MGKEKKEANKGNSSETNREATQEEIRALAYQLFCECGCAHGQDVEYRLEAERRVLEKYRRSRTTRRLLCRVRYPVSCDSRAEG